VIEWVNTHAGRPRRVDLGALLDGESTILVPRISPNHVTVVAPKCNICPADFPRPPAPGSPAPGPVLPGGGNESVVLIDTGYVEGWDPLLDARVATRLGGPRLDGSLKWTVNQAADWIGQSVLDGIGGHGTFIAGQIARACDSTIVSVGHRENVATVAPGSASQLFTSELAIARSLLSHTGEVVHCGFAFPTLNGVASLPIALMLMGFAAREAPRPRPDTVIVAPAGNESSPAPFWPAAHPWVVGVAASEDVAKLGHRPAPFSNWGRWCDCVAPGRDVVSTYVDTPRISDGVYRTFAGLAAWSGTSFAAPTISAAIARRVAAGEAPRDAAVSLLTSSTMSLTKWGRPLPHFLP